MTSTPSSSGRCTIGVAKVLSHTTIAPASWAAAAIADRSATSSRGLVGDSSHTRSAPGSAATTASVSAGSTRRSSRTEPSAASASSSDSVVL